MSSLRPWRTCHSGPLRSRKSWRYAGTWPVAVASAKPRTTSGGSASVGSAAAVSAVAHSVRGTPCGKRLSVRLDQVISGTSASKRVAPLSRSSLKAPTNW